MLRLGRLATIAGLILFLPASGAWALDVPPFSAPVVDQAGILSGSERASLSERLIAIERSGGPQIAILLIPSLEGESVEGFSIRVAEKWKAGSAKLGDGVILLVSRDDRKVRIEVGQGIEGSLTDLRSAHVIRHTIAPAFRQGSYARGLENAAQEIADIVTGKAQPSDERWHGERPLKIPVGLFFIVMLILIVFGPLIRLLGGGTGRRSWRGSGWGGGSGWTSGGSGWSGGGGGGFSGGGGGGFSGGGASGSW